MILTALGFASYRAVQLVVHDTIGDPLRARLETWYADGIRPGRTNRFRAFIRSLLSCIYCVGWWLSLITTLAYLTAAGQWGAASLWVHAIECWAVMGIQALMSRVDDSLPIR
jgi:hypothetical protein